MGKKPDIGEALVHVDESKAFDRVDHHYHDAVLEAPGLGSDFRGRIKAIYYGIRSSVQVNGYLSEPFNIKLSVRQGCSLSLLLYVLLLSLCCGGCRV